MIPIRDVIPSRTTPWVTLSLIAVNVAVFAYAWSLSPTAHQDLLNAAGLVSADFRLSTALTAMFVHTGWLHLSGNLLALWLFGDNVEDRMGHGRFFAFYLIAGLVAALTQTWAAASAVVPLVGASGAIAGVLGAYVLSFPHSRILVFVPVFIYWELLEVPAILFLGLWFLLQILGGLGAPVDAASLATWGLIGGLATGLVVARLFQQRERRRVDWWGR